MPKTSTPGTQSEMFTFRLSPELLQRAAALVPKVGAVSVSRAAIIRLAIERGLDALEEEFGKRRRKR